LADTGSTTLNGDPTGGTPGTGVREMPSSRTTLDVQLRPRVAPPVWGIALARTVRVNASPTFGLVGDGKIDTVAA
jgi:hypothetical protein